jgi:Cys-tRNA(Pro)/Cys-tRNA(Cys) deacylase
MQATIKKTNAARFLDSVGIGYSLCAGEVNPDDLSALALASSMGVAPELMYKTLVLQGFGCSATPDDTLIFMACIPGPAELDLKKAAKVAGCKSAAMVPLKEVLPLTGYVRGGCSPLAAKKAYPVFLDESAILHKSIYVSAGLRGVQLFLTPDDLLQAVNGQYADLCRS